MAGFHLRHAGRVPPPRLTLQGQALVIRLLCLLAVVAQLDRLRQGRLFAERRFPKLRRPAFLLPFAGNDGPQTQRRLAPDLPYGPAPPSLHSHAGCRQHAPQVAGATRPPAQTPASRLLPRQKPLCRVCSASPCKAARVI